MRVAALHGAPRNAGRELTLENKGVGGKGANSKLRCFAAGENEGLRSVGAECRANAGGGTESQTKAEDADAVLIGGIQLLELEFGDRMGCSRDEQCARCRRHERGHGARGSEAGERLRQAGRARVEKAGQVLRCTGQSIEIDLVGAVADEQSLAGIKGRLKLSGMRDVEDAATDRKREKALKANLRALARGVFDFQSSVANGAASGRKSRGEKAARNSSARCAASSSAARGPRAAESTFLKKSELGSPARAVHA